jgi:hypothetical protein
VLGNLAQKMPGSPCIPVGIQLDRAEIGPTSGPTPQGVFLTLEVLYMARPEVSEPAVELMLQILPALRSRMPTATALLIRIVLVRLAPST